MRFLASYAGALVVVSHDLALLDGSITQILHLDRDGIVRYRGTYSEYREARRLEEARLVNLAARQQAEIDRLKTLADSMRGQTAKRARKAKTLDSRVGRLRCAGSTAQPRSARLGTASRPRRGRVRSSCVRGAREGVRRAARVRKRELRSRPGRAAPRDGSERGRQDEPAQDPRRRRRGGYGRARLGLGVSLGYYAQEHEGIAEEISALAHVRAESTDASDQDLRGLLGMFGLTGATALQPAGTLSGGEKTKLALAQLVAGRRNLVLLDEPTNNLDPPSRTAVAEALAGWTGSMLLVSHDVEFVRALAPHRVLMMPEGDLSFWDEDLLELVALA